jgi:BioD-like phosphotransacetylase family protein
LKAAERHCVFNYENIAEYYAHSEKKVSGELIEIGDRPLVIMEIVQMMRLKMVVKLTDEWGNRLLRYGYD